MIDLPGKFQILVAELVAATREDILGLQLRREVVKKIAAIGPCLDFNNDVVWILTDLKRMTIRFLARCDEFRSREEDIFSWPAIGGVCVLISWPPSWGRLRWWIADSDKRDKGLIECVVLAAKNEVPFAGG